MRYPSPFSPLSHPLLAIRQELRLLFCTFVWLRRGVWPRLWLWLGRGRVCVWVCVCAFGTRCFMLLMVLCGLAEPPPPTPHFLHIFHAYLSLCMCVCEWVFLSFFSSFCQFAFYFPHTEKGNRNYGQTVWSFMQLLRSSIIDFDFIFYLYLFLYRCLSESSLWLELLSPEIALFWRSCCGIT